MILVESSPCSAKFTEAMFDKAGYWKAKAMLAMLDMANHCSANVTVAMLDKASHWSANAMLAML